MNPSSDLDKRVIDEIENLKQKVNSVFLPPELKIKVEGMIFRLEKMVSKGSFSSEFEPVSTYINWVISIPWNKLSKDRIELKEVKSELDAHHFGLEDVKSRLLQYLAVIKLQNNRLQEAKSSESSDMSKLQGSSSHAPILCFVGIQGVGKTSMAKSIANALGRKFIRISLGGLGSVTEIRGIPRGNFDAEPGQIIKALVRSGTMNPLILLDEIDKVSSTTGLRSDVMAALLEVLDPEQNATFMDKYIDFPVNLSNVIFVTTANNLGGVSAALQDRLEIIRFGSYTDNDKIMIAKNYLLPKVREATGIGENQLVFDDEVWPLVIRPLGFDAGVRQLERTLTELARKVALKIVEGEISQVHLTKENFRQFIPEDMGVYS